MHAADAAQSWMPPYPIQEQAAYTVLVDCCEAQQFAPPTYLPSNAMSLPPAIGCSNRCTTRNTSGAGRSRCRQARARLSGPTLAPVPSIPSSRLCLQQRHSSAASGSTMRATSPAGSRLDVIRHCTVLVRAPRTVACVVVAAYSYLGCDARAAILRPADRYQPPMMPPTWITPPRPS